jgi:hypothetical protein
MKRLQQKIKITVWIDYGSEGWHPVDFVGAEYTKVTDDVIKFIMNGISSPFRVTREMFIELQAYCR